MSVATNKRFKRCTLHGGGIFAHMQTRALKRLLREINQQRSIVFNILLVFAFTDLIQRWLSNINMTVLYQLTHLPKEKGQQQRTNMRSIHIRVRHNHDGVVSKLGKIKFFCTNTTTQRRYQGTNFHTRQHLVETSFLNVKNLTFKRQNCLCFTGSTLLGRTTSRISLH